MQAALTTEPASPWVMRFAPLIREGGTILDLACGAGRNARWLAAQGWQVEAVDRDAALLEGLRDVNNICVRHADLENAAWPYAARTFDGIVVCRYLHRPLLPLLAASLAENGVLIYETFMLGQEKYGRPKNADFLLKPNELMEYFNNKLEVLCFEQGVFYEPQPRSLQRICLRNKHVATLHTQSQFQ